MADYLAIGDAPDTVRARKRFAPFSEQSLANRLIFRDVYGFRPLGRRHGWIAGSDRDGRAFATPLDLLEMDSDTAAALLREGHRIGPATREQADALARRLGTPLDAESRREDSDYLYAADDLRTLSAPHFAKARQYGQQLRASGVTASPFRPADAEEAHQVVEAWRRRRRESAGPHDAAESHAAIDLAAARLIDGVAVRRAGEMIGFLLFDATIDDTIVALILKTAMPLQGLADFAFQACALARPDKRYLNSCQDLGIPGLRARKLAMRPIEILSKYYLSLPGEAAPR